jgi:hypothetical protein
MDGACYSNQYFNGQGPYTSNPPCNGIEGGPTYPPYSYMDPTLDAPYFFIAKNYGFANYMFQTSEGPSFPAHQFLFSGTSSPVYPGDTRYPSDYYQYFAAWNPSEANPSGCPVITRDYGYPMWIAPDGVTEMNDPNHSMCYGHNTLVTYQTNSGIVQSNNNVTWNYFVPLAGLIWDAPEGNTQTCYTQISTGTCVGTGDSCGTCGGTEFNNVILPQQNGLSSAPIFDYIQSCELPQISWVIPDEAWSDHPDDVTNDMVGEADHGKGPDWVAEIVNAIGKSWENSRHTCDYWGTEGTGDKAQPTAIFITWDDWGGFFDHVPPRSVYTITYQDGEWPCTNLTNSNFGCGYVYGFRVPLLVVSEYTPAGYVSGAVQSYPPTYPPPQIYTHDFGSILAFAEYNFGLNPIAYEVQPVNGQNITYADQNSLDATAPGCSGGENGVCVPLWDFFTNTTRQFASIPLVDEGDTQSFTTEQNGSYPVPTGPDEGADGDN